MDINKSRTSRLVPSLLLLYYTSFFLRTYPLVMAFVVAFRASTTVEPLSTPFFLDLSSLFL